MERPSSPGFGAGLRSFTGGGLFATDFRASAPGSVSFAPRFPGTIMPEALRAGEALVCRKETFLCCAPRSQ